MKIVICYDYKIYNGGRALRGGNLSACRSWEASRVGFEMILILLFRLCEKSRGLGQNPIEKVGYL